MTDYNDRCWHGWAKREKPPLHDLTRIERVYINGAGQIMDDSKSGSSASVGSTCWDNDLYPNSVILAFRVAKEHKEPREFWLIKDAGELAKVLPMKPIGVWDEVVHVREVLE
ncbi:MAG: hypothetical protein ABJL49_05525 [Parasphingorhabdus sp.]|uniref:hypothetical protein n=1 Tax=Alphaproteobacteria TaxID=28211 RepID=UPI00326543DE